MSPDFRQMNEQIANLQKLDAGIQGMFGETQQLKEAAVSLCDARKRDQAALRLAEIPVDELKNSKAGIRISLLTEAGYHTLYDLWLSGDSGLYALSGVGEKQVSSIRIILDQFLTRFAESERIRLPEERGDQKADELILSLARYRLAELVCRDAKVPCEDHHVLLEELTGRIRIRSRFRWLFAFPSAKTETLRALEELEAYCRSAEYARIQRFYALYLDAVSISAEAAYSDYEKNSASYYAMLERIGGVQTEESSVSFGIPTQLASLISQVEVLTDGFHGDLRHYQYFGVQYILHQKYVLLGDEMGLGKTIQAIAVMVHLKNVDPGARFLVVCPASVMINWCREIGRFSDISAYLLHGKGMEDSFLRWKSLGGAAVTNYESLRYITPRIDDQMKLNLLVIDEAHYIKNPDAQRTQFIRRLDNESGHILLMTGTPLENKVDEMCELVHFIRPDLEKEVRSHALFRKTEEFRQILAPVYLRRQADQVLAELPALTQTEEWCEMTKADLQAYAKAVEEGNFMSMRRVSYLQEDAAQSSKTMRLLELCDAALEDGRKIVVYSYFRKTLQRISEVLKDTVAGEITGSTDPVRRQEVIDRFQEMKGGSVLLCQIQAGGMGLNIQSASVVIFCEPQIKPSFERQAISRVFRMGQIRNVLVHHLLCAGTVDEAIRAILADKAKEFSLFADESAMAEAESHLADSRWVQSVVEEQKRRFLPAVVS